MIVADRKPLQEILEYIKDYKKIILPEKSGMRAAEIISNRRSAATGKIVKQQSTSTKTPIILVCIRSSH